jgi:hypothetical protein
MERWPLTLGHCGVVGPLFLDIFGLPIHPTTGSGTRHIEFPRAPKYRNKAQRYLDTKKWAFW